MVDSETGLPLSEQGIKNTPYVEQIPTVKYKVKKDVDIKEVAETEAPGLKYWFPMMGI